MFLKLFHTLFDIYGEQHWWPSKSGSRWEIVAGAVLVQNTAWGNVEKALENLEAADLMSPENIASFPEEKLRETIRPAGFFRQKAAYLKAVFIIDAYTRRIAERHLGLDGKLPYDDLQKIFMSALPPDADLYGEYHALILALGKDSCRKSGCGPVCARLVSTD